MAPVRRRRALTVSSFQESGVDVHAQRDARRRRQARCTCGELSLTVEGEPILVGVCHCLECQRRTGAPFGSGAFFSVDQVVQRSETTRPYERIGGSGAKLIFHFCPACGSTVYWT